MKNIHIIKTNKTAKLHHKNGHLGGPSTIVYIQEFAGNKHNSFHLYITNDEEIKQGDWAITPNPQKPLEKVTKETYLPHYNKKQKIILTTDQDLINDGVQAIDDEFLEWFVRNSSCESVDIEKEHIYKATTYDQPDRFVGIEYKIIIPKEETLEKAAERLAYACNDDFIDGAKWQAERMISREGYEDALNAQKTSNAGFMSKINELETQIKGMYSEEEVESLLHRFMQSRHPDWHGYSTSKWFEQYKKK